MRGQKSLVLVVVVALAISAGVYAYYLTMPRVSLLFYPDSKVTGCKQRLNETVILHVKNDGTVDLYVNGSFIGTDIGLPGTTYFFQSDIVIPVGVETIIIFSAGGGEVLVETVSGPPGAVATGGVYAISDNPDPNPFILGGEIYIWIHTRAGLLGGHGFHLALMP